MTITSDKTKAINDLYIIQRHRYLKQSKGKTITCKAGEIKTNNKTGAKFKVKPLNDSFINEHLQGKATYGVFATYQTKFMLFDFDFKDSFTQCKWYYYRVREALIDIGISEQCIYCVNSGNKGLHLTLYFDSPITVKQAQDIYKRSLNVAGIVNKDEVKKIEFRPTQKQGVKLPLGLHYKTKKKACFVDNVDGEKQLSDDTILHINKIPIDVIYEVLEIEPSEYDKMNDDEIEEAAEIELYANVNKLEVYELGQDESFTADYYNDLYSNGLKTRGTRHNATLMLAIFFKDYYKFKREDVFNTLKEWLTNQEKTLYTTKFEEALKDTRQIVDDVFDKNYRLNIKRNEIHISVNELRTILTARNINNKHFTHKQRLVLFALLLHSKRYTNENKRVFYMTYQQMTKATGVTNRRILQDNITQFEQVGLITIHKRNQAQEGTYIKQANEYEILFVDDHADTIERIDNSLIDDAGLFQMLIMKHFSQHELRTMLPKGQIHQYKSS